VHVALSSGIKGATNARALTAVGELEQALVYGDKGSQDLIKWLSGESGSESVFVLVAPKVCNHRRRKKMCARKATSSALAHAHTTHACFQHPPQQTNKQTNKQTEKHTEKKIERAATLDASDRLRLFLCYAATHPDKLAGAKAAQWAKLARLEPGEMAAATNLAYLGCKPSPDAGAGASAKALSFIKRKGGKAAGGTYKKREGREEGEYALSR
jgi:hypothetical protein